MTTLDLVLGHPQLPPDLADRLTYWKRIGLERAQGDLVPICVIGEFSNGKSTFLNALVGTEGLLGSDVLPETDVVVALEAAEMFRVRAHRYGKQAATWPPAASTAVPTWARVRAVLAKLKSESKELARIDIEGPFPSLPTGVRLMDTPGINSGEAQHEQKAREAMLGSAGVLFVLDAQYPGRAVEVALLAEICRWAPRVSLVFNKADLLDDDEREELLEVAAEMLSEADGDPASPIHIVSSLPTNQAPGAPLSTAPILETLVRWRDRDTPEQRERHVLGLTRHALREASEGLETHVADAGRALEALSSIVAEDPEAVSVRVAGSVLSDLSGKRGALVTGYTERLEARIASVDGIIDQRVSATFRASKLTDEAEALLSHALDTVVQEATVIRTEFTRELGEVLRASAADVYAKIGPDQDLALPDGKGLLDLQQLQERARAVKADVRRDVNTYLEAGLQRKESLNTTSGMAVWFAIMVALLISGVGAPVAIVMYIIFKITHGTGIRGFGAVIGFVVGAIIGGVSAPGGASAAIGYALLGGIIGPFVGYWVTDAILMANSRGDIAPLRDGTCARIRDGLGGIRRLADTAVRQELLGGSGTTEAWIQEAGADVSQQARAHAVAACTAHEQEREACARRLVELQAVRDLCAERA